MMKIGKCVGTLTKSEISICQKRVRLVPPVAIYASEINSFKRSSGSNVPWQKRAHPCCRSSGSSDVVPLGRRNSPTGRKCNALRE